MIGEIAKRLPAQLLQRAAQVNWTQIKGFRDFLAHNYDRVELKVVWAAVEDVPTLRAAVEAMLAALDDDSS